MFGMIRRDRAERRVAPAGPAHPQDNSPGAPVRPPDAQRDPSGSSPSEQIQDESPNTAADVPATRDGRSAVRWTTGICAIFAGGGHLALLIAWLAGRDDQFPIPWQPIV